MGRMTKERFQRARYLFDGELGKEMIAHIEAIELELKVAKEDEERAVAATDRLTDNVVQLKRELNESKDENHKLRAAWLELEKQVPKKVVLPKEVAGSIEWFRKQGSSNGEIYELSLQGDLDGLYAEKLFKWIDGKVDRDDLMQALVNGYAVEQTKEERLREGIEKTYSEWVNSAILDPKADQLPVFL